MFAEVGAGRTTSKAELQMTLHLQSMKTRTNVGEEKPNSGINDV